MLHKSHSWWDLFLMFNVYILYSVTLDRFYVGQTDDLDKRLVSHLSGISRYTAIAKDWQLVYKEQFNSRTEAIHRENEIKRKKSRKYIEWLINNKSI
jgi:putative endonuclease